jgi:hypothetical protein
MFSDLSAIEWKAREEKLKNQLAETKYRLTERKLQREQKKFVLEDLDDRLLDLSIIDKETDINLAEEKTKGKQILLEQARNNNRYLEGKHVLQQTLWALDLALDETQIAANSQKLEQMKRASQELNQSINDRISKSLGGF